MQPRTARQGRGTVARGDDSEALRRDLLFMRKETGFTPTRIGRAPVLQRLLGGEHEPYDNLRERFVSAVQSLRHPEPELLLDVFGLTSGTEALPRLYDRRRYHGAKHGIGPEAVADRETPALEHLRTQLTTGWYPKSPAPLRVPQSHNGVITEFVEVITVVNEGRWQETREHIRFIAAFEEADFIAISRSVPGIPVSEFEDFTVKTERIGESYTHRFFHCEPMRRGGAYDLRFKLMPDPDAPDPEVLVEESRAFHEPTRTAVFEVVFLGHRPSVVWSYERLTFFERPGDPDVGQRLELGAGLSVRAVFHDLYGGLFSGVAWRWDA